MRIYISGPITSRIDENRAAFKAAQHELIELGHDAVTPFDCGETPLYRECMNYDLNYICQRADALYMLRDWTASPGATAEHALAVALKLAIYYQQDRTMLAAFGTGLDRARNAVQGSS